MKKWLNFFVERQQICEKLSEQEKIKKLIIKPNPISFLIRTIRTYNYINNNVSIKSISIMIWPTN